MESHGDEVLEACLTGNTDVVCAYLETGVPVDTFLEGTLPIIAASYGRHNGIVKCLLDAGATVDLIDNESQSALIRASSEGHTETVKLLLAHGAMVDLQTDSGVTALAAASVNGYSETVRALLDHGADKNMLYGKGVPILRAASERGHSETVRTLLEHGAEVDFLDVNGRSALFAASAAGHTKTVGVLLDYGAEIDLQDRSGTSPLHEACTMGHTETVKRLLHYGAYANIQDMHGTSPLLEACTAGFSQIVKTLLDYGAEGDGEADDEVSPLSIAIMDGHTEVVKLLLDQPGRKDPGVSALVAARSTENVEIQKLFEERGYELKPSVLAEQVKSQMETERLLTAGEEEEAKELKAESNSLSGAKPPEKSGLEGIDLNAMKKTDLKAMKKMQGEIMERLSDLQQPPAPAPEVVTDSNPSLQTSAQLSLGNVLRELIGQDQEWQNIGALLDLPAARLNAISADYSRTRECLREMVMEWLKMVDPPPTWELLVEAVELIDPQTAESIRTKYCQK
jgi:ankyrin repeat protein